MPFDLSSAQPVSSGFDLASAKPVGDTDAPAKKTFTAKDYLAAVPEAAASLGSGLASSIGGGLAGMADAPLYAAGISKTQPADVVRNVQQAGTYQPRTQGGQALNSALGYLPGKLAQGGNWAGEKTASATGSPALGAAVNTGIQSIPMLLGSEFLKPGAAAAGSAVSPEIAAAQALKLKLTPEQAQSGVIGQTAQSLAGSAKLERAFSRANAPQVNAAGAQELKIPNLGPQSILAAKAPANAIYKQVASVGQVPLDAQFKADIAGISNPGGGSFAFDIPPAIDKLKTGYGGISSFDAGDAVSKVRQLRADAAKNIKAPMQPEQNALGYAQQKVSQAIEDQLDRHIQANAGANGISPNLIDQYRGARVQLAKIHSVEDAMDGPNLSAKELGKQQDRGVPLSGNLKGIADAYSNFDRSLQPVSKLRDSGPFGVPDLLLGAAGGLAHPGLLASILARPAARAALGSNLYQRMGIGGQPLIGAPSVPGLMGAAKALPLQNQPQGLLQ